MKTEGKFILMTLEEFASWLANFNLTREIRLIQIHHTWQPDYHGFYASPDHIQMCKYMEHYQVTQRGFSEIAQNITIFPDGLICIGRDLNKIPAGIAGANQYGICIENIGNFDANHDQISELHQIALLHSVAYLLMKVGINIADENTVVYHHWYDLTTHRRTNGSGNTKTCPGTAFFGGNTVESAKENFLPLIDDIIKKLIS